MKKRKKEEELGSASETVSSGPVGFRREVRSESSCSQVGRRTAIASRRKKAKPGGIHQRANKRTNW